MGYPKGFRKCVAIKDLRRIKSTIEEIETYLLGSAVEWKLKRILDIVNYYIDDKA